MAKDIAMCCIRRTLFPLALAVSAATALAQPSLTPARYVQCQIFARAATLTGVEERSALVQRRASVSEQRHADELARARVDRAFASCGFGVGALGAYAYRNEGEINAWLAANPAQKSRLDALHARIASAGAQFSPPRRVAVEPKRSER